MRRFVQAFSSGDGFPADFPTALRESLMEAPDRYNIAVRKPACVIVLEGGKPVVREFQWGLVPRWSRTAETPYTTVTARLERAATSRLFKQAWETRHCVVPLNGYYKWDRTVKPPVPHFIQAGDGRAMMVAGLWECWEKGEAPLCSFSVLTHANAAIPPPLVADGPVFLPPDRWMRWLDPDRWFPKRFLLDSAQPALESYPVSRAIRDPLRDDYMLLEPADAVSPEDAFDVDEDEFNDEDA
ncbi:MAG TPA: SOS response-associated peptidase [Pseudoxanthomonas sp.]|nr:SOS response-associated peptidase [Pseudoxanthomonas sp.]